MFFEGRIFFWQFVSRSDTPKFRKQFSRLLCKDYQGKLTTLLEPLHSHCLMIHLNSFVATGKTKDAIIHLNFDTRLPAKTRFASGYEVNRYSRLRVESENVKELQPSKNTFYPQFKGATARYYATHTKTMLPTRKSEPRSSRQSGHTKTF